MGALNLLLVVMSTDLLREFQFTYLSTALVFILELTEKSGSMLLDTTLSGKSFFQNKLKTAHNYHYNYSLSFINHIWIYISRNPICVLEIGDKK